MQDAEKDTRRSQAHISTSHVTDIIESCHTHQRVMSHISTSYVPRPTEDAEEDASTLQGGEIKRYKM